MFCLKNSGTCWEILWSCWWTAIFAIVWWPFAIVWGYKSCLDSPIWVKVKMKGPTQLQPMLSLKLTTSTLFFLWILGRHILATVQLQPTQFWTKDSCWDLVQWPASGFGVSQPSDAKILVVYQVYHIISMIFDICSEYLIKHVHSWVYRMSLGTPLGDFSRSSNVSLIRHQPLHHHIFAKQHWSDWCRLPNRPICCRLTFDGRSNEFRFFPFIQYHSRWMWFQGLLPPLSSTVWFAFAVPLFLSKFKYINITGYKYIYTYHCIVYKAYIYTHTCVYIYISRAPARRVAEVSRFKKCNAIGSENKVCL